MPISKKSYFQLAKTVIMAFFVVCLLNTSQNSLTAQTDRNNVATELERLNQRYLYLFNELIDLKDVTDEQSRRINRFSAGTQTPSAEIEDIKQRLFKIEESNTDSLLLMQMNELNHEISLLKNQLNELNHSEIHSGFNLTNVIIFSILIVVLFLILLSFILKYSRLRLLKNNPGTSEANYNQTRFTQHPEHINKEESTQTDKKYQHSAQNGKQSHSELTTENEQTNQGTELVKAKKIEQTVSTKKNIDHTGNLDDEIALDLLYKEAETLVRKIKSSETTEEVKEKLEENFNQIFQKIVAIKERS